MAARLHFLPHQPGEHLFSLDRIGEVVTLHTDLFEPPPDTLHGPSRHLITGAFKLDGRLMLALDTARATNTTAEELG